MNFVTVFPNIYSLLYAFLLFSDHLLSLPLLAKSATFKVQSLRHCSTLSHVTDSGEAKMVDVGAKYPTKRYASAYAEVHVGNEIIKLIHENNMKKGDVLSVAKLAGIMAAKKTSDLIPLCHNIALAFSDVSLVTNCDTGCIQITSNISCHAKTGVEMEALTAVAVAALTVYDMCKAISHDISIQNVRLIKKTGGKKDYYRE